MVAQYTILGQKVGSHVVSGNRVDTSAELPLHWFPAIDCYCANALAFSQLAMITLGTTFGGAILASRGGGKKTTQTPPINASTQDEADFIK